MYRIVTSTRGSINGEIGRRARVATLLALAMIVNSCAGKQSAQPDEQWSLHGHDNGEQRFSPLTQIDPANVARLGVAWYADFDTRTLRGVEDTPLVVDGVMYAIGAWNKVLALDAATGRKLWEYDPELNGDTARKACCDVGNRGVAYDNGKIFFGALDGRLIALDAKTGHQLWSVLTTDPGKYYSISGAPRIVKGKVIIGNGGAEGGVRGYVSAYDEADGKLAWRFYTVPGDPAKGFENPAMKMAAKTWSGEWWKYGGGGTVWDSMAYDPALDLLYIGVGNAGPWNRAIRSPGGGDNLFTSSIVALRPETGEYAWHFQTTPGDEWDFTATQHIILADITIGGRLRKVLFQAPKNGFFYVIDRETGKFISAKNYVPVTWTTGIDPNTGRAQVAPEARYGETGKLYIGKPSPAGGHNWQPMSYSPKTGLVYLPTLDMAAGYFAERKSEFRFNPRSWNTGLDPVRAEMPEDPAFRAHAADGAKAALTAWDPRAQKVVWSVPMKVAWNGGTLATAANLVFQGNGAGDFAAYDATNGKLLWSMAMQSGIVAPPITYSIKGTQYVAVAVGWGGSLPLMAGSMVPKGVKPRVNRIVAFRLDGQVRLPAVASEPPQQPDLPAPTGAPAVIENGRRMFHLTCAMCHGDGAVNNTSIPDLRRSPMIATSQSFEAVVLGGALKEFGMPEFSKEYSKRDLEQIRQYLLKRARDLKTNGI